MSNLSLNLINLKYFCDAARLGSISAAAKENYVTQSAISQGIAKLERELNKQLIAHHPNRFQLNPDGEMIYQKGSQVLQSIIRMEDELREMDGDLKGKVNFACMHSFAMAVLPKHLRKVREQYPGLEFNFRLGHPGIIKRLIKQGTIDFGIVLDNNKWEAYTTHEVYSGHYRLYVSPDIKPKDHLPFILSEYRTETRVLKEHYEKKMGREMEILMRVSSWEVMASLVEEGLGVGFFPDYIAEKHKGTLVEYPLDMSPIPYRILAIHPSSHDLSRHAEAFLSLITTSLAKS